MSVSSNVKEDEIELWIEKTTALENAIKGLADGKIAAENVSLKQYGILTPEEKIEKNQRKEKAQEVRLKKRLEKEQFEREEERKRWWERVSNIGALDMRKSGTLEEKNQIISHREAPNGNQLSIRYSSDYSRWSDARYIPDDTVSKQDEEEIKKILEKKENEKFEKANSEWCQKFKEDAKAREDERRRKQVSACELRIKGNSLFKARRFESALETYYRALDLDPFAVKVLLNIALTCKKIDNTGLALEFCNRVIHIDNQSVKAWFIRHQIFVELKRHEAALKDIEVCISIDPQNIFFSTAREIIISMIQDDDVEKILSFTHPSETKEKLEHYTINVEDDTSKEPTTSFTTEKCKVVECQCEFIDNFMTYFTGSPEKNLHNVLTSDLLDKLVIRHTLLIEGKPSLIDVFIQKLHECKIARAYMRTSGNLHSICDFLLAAQVRLSSMQNREILYEENFVNMVYSFYLMMNGFVSEEIRSKAIVVEKGLVDSMLSLIILPFDQETDNWFTVKLKISACKFLLSMLDEKYAFINSHFFNKISVRKIVQVPYIVLDQIITTVNDLDLHHQVMGIKTCTDLFSTIYNRKLKVTQEIELNNPIAILIKALNNIYEKNKLVIGIDDPMISIVSTLVDLSANKELSVELWFCSNHALGVTILFKIVEDFKHHTWVICDMVLTVLINILTRFLSNKMTGTCLQDTNILVNDGQTINPISIILDLCCHPDTSQVSIVMKNHAVTLLDKLCSLNKCCRIDVGSIISKESIHKLATVFLNIVVSESFSNTNSKLSKIDLNAYSELVINLARLLAQYANEINDWLRLTRNSLKHFICLFPLPSNDTNGVITKRSVCQKPLEPTEGTPHYKISRKSSFYGNILKIIITYLKAHGKDDAFLILQQNFAVERLVCLLANSSSFHDSTTKNAAIVLARLMNSNDPSVTKLCRELRGVEIIMQLSKSGTITI